MAARDARDAAQSEAMKATQHATEVQVKMFGKRMAVLVICLIMSCAAALGRGAKQPALAAN